MKTEKELVNIFLEHLRLNSIDNIEEEVITKNLTRTDIVIRKDQISYSFEAKLNDIVHVWTQAFRNKAIYDHSFIVMPISKKSIFSANNGYLSRFKKDGIGIILVDYNNLKILNKRKEFLSIFKNN